VHRESAYDQPRRAERTSVQKNQIKAMSKSVFCIANNRLIAERIIERLEEAGFSLASISVLYPEPGGIRDIGHEKNSKAQKVR
jgi:hypothetical protein